MPSVSLLRLPYNTPYLVRRLSERCRPLLYHTLLQGVCYVPNSVGLENVEKYDHETDELPNPRPTQPKKNYRLKVAFGPLFPKANIFSWVGIGFV